MKKIIFVLLFCLSNILFSQSKKMFGSVSDNINVIADVNIFNKNSKRASITNYKGEFEIFVELRDTLEFSYLGYKTSKVIVDNSHLGITGLQIKLQKKAIVLDVVNIKRNNLLGQLVSDAGKVKEQPSFLKQLKLPFPNAKAATYEERKMTFGGGGSIGALYGILSGEKRKMKIMLKAKHTEEVVIRLEKEYGYFVLNDLKIRKENVSRFLFFCCESKGFKNAETKLSKLIKFMKTRAKEFKKLNPQ